jgi:hypothetical protein
MQVAKVLARAGMRDSARAVITLARGASTPDWLSYDEAHARLLLGERDHALHLLGISLRSSPDTAYLARDWWFDGLHDDPRFKALVGGHASK